MLFGIFGSNLYSKPDLNSDLDIAIYSVDFFTQSHINKAAKFIKNSYQDSKLDLVFIEKPHVLSNLSHQLIFFRDFMYHGKGLKNESFDIAIKLNKNKLIHSSTLAMMKLLYRIDNYEELIQKKDKLYKKLIWDLQIDTVRIDLAYPHYAKGLRGNNIIKDMSFATIRNLLIERIEFLLKDLDHQEYILSKAEWLLLPQGLQDKYSSLDKPYTIKVNELISHYKENLPILV